MERKSTDQLVEGDTVLHYGMRILIDGPARVYINDGHTVYVWPGLVTNADELCDEKGENYDGFIACHLRGTWFKDRVPAPRLDEWNIVGNDMALWFTEEETS